MMKRVFVSTFYLLCFLASFTLSAQTKDRWQQKVDYKMDVTLDVKTHQFNGTQHLEYTNNSSDTLDKVFYHLYFNAFQPNSMMDVRSRTISDPDGRVRDRISKLIPSEIGYLYPTSLKHQGKDVYFKVEGTILEVKLNEPILPNSTTSFDMEFKGQVPVQIRRSGRDNAEGVAYSMAQWYPKLSEYDYQGWHANPYVGREFHGVWGDFDVKITLDEDYVVASTGYIQNPEIVGKGYGGYTKSQSKKGMLTWHFKAPNVHDFTWAADPDYQHKVVKMENGPELHFFWKKDQDIDNNWNQLPDFVIQTINYLKDRVGEYPYDVYNVVQGGDGGMEYGMLTLVTGKRSLNSLVGVTVHELLHSWYQFILANNESLYPWMDEGFNSYMGNEIERDVLGKKGDPHAGTYGAYYRIVAQGDEEPISTHADHYKKNRAYSIASYVKGAVFLHQLSYVIGQDYFDKGLKRYYNEWKFKHPNPNDFIRIMEKESGMELDWYKEYMVNTTKTIDYSIDNISSEGDSTYITLRRLGEFPMPIDLEITYEDGEKVLYYIPLRIMRGEKNNETAYPRKLMEDWPWTHPSYTLSIPTREKSIKTIEIDPTKRMADIDKTNNILKTEKLILSGPGL